MIQVKQIGAFVGGCMFVLTLASCSSTTSAPKIDPSVKWSQKDNAFYERNVNAAFNHARAAEVAGSQGNNALLVQHAQLALAEVNEAQRAGSNTPLDEATVSLKKSVEEGQKGQTQEATQDAKDAREKLSHAADVRIVDSNNKIP
jgi:small metal-binding protein